jgi:hypothetical protein
MADWAYLHGRSAACLDLIAATSQRTMRMPIPQETANGLLPGSADARVYAVDCNAIFGPLAGCWILTPASITDMLGGMCTSM